MKRGIQIDGDHIQAKKDIKKPTVNEIRTDIKIIEPKRAKSTTTLYNASGRDFYDSKKDPCNMLQKSLNVWGKPEENKTTKENRSYDDINEIDIHETAKSVPTSAKKKLPFNFSEMPLASLHNERTIEQENFQNLLPKLMHNFPPPKS